MVRGGEVNIATGALKEINAEYATTTSSIQSDSNERQSSASNHPQLPTTLGIANNSKFINRLDKNKDGKVALSEFQRGEKRFKHLDKNNNGYISADEAPTGPDKKSR
jgi:hypothetical protein